MTSNALKPFHCSVNGRLILIFSLPVVLCKIKHFTKKKNKKKASNQKKVGTYISYVLTSFE